MDSQNLGPCLFVWMRQFNLSIQSPTSQQSGIQDIGTICGSNDLDHFVTGETIQLTEKFQHGTLDFTIAALISTESFCTNGIDLINKEDCARRHALLYLGLGKLKGVSNKFGSVSNEHLHQLRAGQFEKDGIGLIGTRSCQQGLSGTGWSVQQDSLGRTNTNSIKHVLVRHGQDHSFNEFLDLLISTSNVTVFFRGSFVDFHGLHAAVKFFRQLFQNEIRVLVSAHQIARFEFIGIHKARDGQKDGLSSRRSDHCRPSLSIRIGIGGVSRFFFFLIEAIFGIWFQHFHNICNQVRKLLVQFHLFLVFSNSITLATRLVGDSLNIRLHDTNIVVDQVNALSQLSNRHVPCFLVLQGLHRGRRWLCWLFAVGLFGLFIATVGAAVPPDIVSF
mmetsp:Transcript_62077/g.173336  ORF Transcript_62077/g.173336 Transcript_62077/m.173336 type:complete len:390 (+) Transcript_62077:291-1460(+)